MGSRFDFPFRSLDTPGPIAVSMGSLAVFADGKRFSLVSLPKLPVQVSKGIFDAFDCLPHPFGFVFHGDAERAAVLQLDDDVIEKCGELVRAHLADKAARQARRQHVESGGDHSDADNRVSAQGARAFVLVPVILDHDSNPIDPQPFDGDAGRAGVQPVRPVTCATRGDAGQERPEDSAEGEIVGVYRINHGTLLAAAKLLSGKGYHEEVA